jgi:intein/homing endonuclease
VTDLELAYLAGFFDGEGCVHINSPDRAGRQNLLIRVSQTEPSVLLLYESRWQGKISTRENGPNRKPIWLWTACSQNATECLKDLLPYLRVKSAAALVGVEFQALKEGENNLSQPCAPQHREHVKERRRDCHARLSALNKRGR